MGEPLLRTQPLQIKTENRLDSWKEIAAYLKRDVTTVQRWEKREGMPVHRHLHDRIGSVYAFKEELDEWVRSRNLRGAQDTEESVTFSDSAPAPPTPFVASGRRVKWRTVSILSAAVLALAIGAGMWLFRKEYFWRNPLASARFQIVTEFEGLQQAAAISKDGRLLAFLSDRDGHMDIWVTQVGSGEFHNLTHNSVPGLGNSSIRALGFSPDGSLATYWDRKSDNSNGEDISVWGVPVLGGEPRPYLNGVAEFDWTRDDLRLAYHTPGPGDPIYISSGDRRPSDQPIFTASAGLHSHFPLWAPDANFLYFVRGTLPDKMDIWRIRPTGGPPERITSQSAGITYPVLLNRSTLLYLASDPDGSGPWLYGMDLRHRIPHRLTLGPDRYTSLAASANGRRLVATRATPVRNLWRLRIGDSPGEVSQPERIPLTTGTGFAPRFGPNYLLYVSANGGNESIWKWANGTSRELWHTEDARILGEPAISPDGQQIAFTLRRQSKTFLYTMLTNGTNARIVTNALDLEGAPTWAPDGRSITSAADDNGVPHLFRVPLDGGAPSSITSEYSLDPVWSPDGQFVLYSGPDIGTTFPIKAVTDAGSVRALPPLTLTRGARHVSFLRGGRSLVFLRGSVQHKDLWLLDLKTGTEQQLTHFAPDFAISSFDISADGRDVVLERARELSDVVLVDLPTS